MTATFQLVYVVFIMEVDTRRLLHFNVTRHPTADWTLQQFRECVTGDEGYRFVISEGLPSCNDVDSRRFASRIPAGESPCLTLMAVKTDRRYLCGLFSKSFAKPSRNLRSSNHRLEIAATFPSSSPIHKFQRVDAAMTCSISTPRDNSR
jgi:hypothetical protein